MRFVKQVVGIRTKVRKKERKPGFESPGFDLVKKELKSLLLSYIMCVRPMLDLGSWTNEKPLICGGFRDGMQVQVLLSAL